MKTSLSILLLSASISVCAQGASTPEELFEQYVFLGDNFDASVAKLYSDNAEIVAFRKYPHGLERVMSLTGKDWKALMVKMMPAAKQANDISRYQSVEIQRLGTGYKLKADRYSERKCYLDTGYYMIVEPNENGELLIMKEYMETQPQSDC